MDVKWMLWPLLVQVLLTVAVYLRLGQVKGAAAARGEVDEARRALDEDAWPDSVRVVNNNIRNQFEVPVLFFALVLALVSIRAVDPLAVGLAFVFVLSRVFHAIEHLGRNHVPTRRRIFTVGCVLVLGLAARLVWALV